MFCEKEYQLRINKLQQLIIAADIDFFIVRTDVNVMYLTGVDFFSGERKVIMVVPAKGKPILIVPLMEYDRLSAAKVDIEVVSYWEMDAMPERGWSELLHSVIGSAKSVGVEPLAEADIVIELIKYKWLVLSLVENIRVIKSASEINLIKRVAGYWTLAMNEMLAKLRVGSYLSDLISVGQQTAESIYSVEPGSNYFNTQPNIVYQLSPESSNPHHLSVGKHDVISDGPIIINSMGFVNWYNAENERTILAGKFTAEQAELFDISTQGQQLALDLIRPGISCGEVDCNVQSFFVAEGVADYMRHRAGHGFGMEGHERPYTSEGSQDVYRSGMVISVEPGLYVEGIGGFRHCDTVLITESGTENFTAETSKLRADLTF